jgi:hypothetical protein
MCAELVVCFRMHGAHACVRLALIQVSSVRAHTHLLRARSFARPHHAAAAQ